MDDWFGEALLQIIRKSLSRFEIGGILKDIRLVDPALEPPVEAEADHLLEPFAIEGEELGHGRLVPDGSPRLGVRVVPPDRTSWFLLGGVRGVSLL